ncbi:glycosyltransferase involved in cell wall biosynthesis [Deinobacterium chartae]|uniref:Glycosyltransferase involved in cell wall biosynthesis n=1 Tax=Deinobacterium chartae TaxID=521158 RepID=A0A841I077_9DEIO|nr:glycosyltransferase [Deinobacterium chartae]MBB6097850.1 glycosyltransferase involved in cell wall biosynthesis [Deinobacterium chartae]
MKIAYFLQLNMGPGTGVYKKVLSQARAWQQLGHVVTLFVVTKRPDVLHDLQHSNLGLQAQVETYSGSRLPAPFDGRLQAMARLVQRLEGERPDVVYTRQDLYLPPLQRLLTRQRVVVEVNTNDLGELRSASLPFMVYYRATRGLLLGRAAGLVYVSYEIAKQPHYAKFRPPHTVIGNGIALEDTRPLPAPTAGPPRLVFIGHAGQPWHGVDKILQLARLRPDWRFDLVGISAQDTPEDAPANVTLHGHLDRASYERILEAADCAVGSLALHRNSMQEASPLKVREYLAYGLPVILGYLDTDFLSGAEFILRLPNTESNVKDTLGDIERFVRSWQGRRVPREVAARLDYAHKEQERIAFFASLLESAGAREHSATRPRRVP